MALALAGLPAILSGWSIVGWLIVAVVVFLVAMPVWSRVVEGGAQPSTASSPRWSGSSFACAMAPLVWLLWVVLKNGLPAINADFLTHSMLNVVGDEQGGILHALIGTLLITLAATVMSVPIGILTAIYLVEYGKRSRAARVITFLVDVMTGIPSIVAGLFALSLFVLLVRAGLPERLRGPSP